MEQQLGRIRQLDLRDLRLVLAALALKSVVPQVGDSDQAAEVADVDAVRIGNLKEALTEELSRAVGYLTICNAKHCDKIMNKVIIIINKCNNLLSPLIPRSISPKRRPPSLALPSIGCLTRI